MQDLQDRPPIAVTTILILILLAAATLPLTAQGRGGDEERRATGLVDAVAAGDAAALVAYLEEHFAPALLERRDAAGWQAFAEQLTSRHGGLEASDIMKRRPHELMIVAASPIGMDITFTFEFETEPPHRITALGLEAGRPRRGGPELPPFEPRAGASREEVMAALEKYFDDLGEKGLFSGAALVAWQGEPIFTTAQGLASRRWNVPNTVDTRFDLGSINKSFTQVAIGQLMAAGKLSLDDTIADHLSDYPNREVAAKVQIRHLLNQSSGLGDIFTDEFFRSSPSLYRSPRDFFPLFTHRPLQFEPGERASYSNAGYMVLGAIIEAASGQTYYDYVADEIFAPAGMKASGFFAHDEPVPDVAEGYTKQHPASGGAYWSNVLMLPARGNSAGSAQATVGDLLRFDNALREHVLLAPAYTAWYFGGDEPTAGAEAPRTRAAAAVGIAGGGPGVSAVLESDADLAVVALSNLDEPGAEGVSRTVYPALRRALRN